MPLPGFITKLISGGSAPLIEKIGQAADSLFTNKEELAQAKTEFEKVINAHTETLAALAEAEVEASYKDMADARNSNVQIQTSAEVPMVVKLRPTIIAYFVTAVWGAMTIYIICSILHFIKRDPSTNFEAVLALYAGLNIIFGNIIQFDFGSSQGSKTKGEQLDKLNSK